MDNDLSNPEAAFINKPEFREGDTVKFQVDEFRGIGKIRGRSTNGLIDYWIVQTESGESLSKEEYPYSCFCVPHMHLKKVSEATEGTWHVVTTTEVYSVVEQLILGVYDETELSKAQEHARKVKASTTHKLTFINQVHGKKPLFGELLPK